MKHTNAHRGTGGQFAPSDAPKAKRIEVWLQPQTIELLDTLCRQWSVGRGKVIDQLLTKGPVPPAAWLEVEQQPVPPPTTSGASSTAVFKVGQRVIFTDGYMSPEGAEGNVCKRDLRGETFFYIVEWVKPDGTVQITECTAEDLTLPTEAPAKPEPDPTPSGQAAPGTSFADELREVEAQGAARWQVAKTDAKRIGCKAEQVQRFKAHHKLPTDRPLSADATQLLQQELEAQSGHTKGEAAATAQRLDRLRERATAEQCHRIASIVTALPSVAIAQPPAKALLLQGLEPVGIKERRKLVAGVWADLKALVPEAVTAEQQVLDHDYLLPEDKPTARCLFWGAVIRLWSNDNDAPEGTAEFLDWSGYSVHQSHAERQSNRVWDNYARVMQGKPSSADDRRILNLPPEAELTRKGISDAYKALAKQHHPDAGGDAAKFQRITEARDRLLLEVAD